MKSEHQFQNILEPHRRALSKLELELGFFLRDVGNIDVFSVQSRIKSRDSAITKSKRLGLKLEELDDLAGLRIIVGTRSEISILERFFTRQEVANDLTVLKRLDHSKKDGYRALHLVVELKSHYQRSIHPGRVEIQLQTIFENAFNFLSRSWRYKNAIEMSQEWNQQFSKLSSTLNTLESIVSSLHSQLIESTSVDADSPLTPHSFRVIAKQEFDEQIDIDDAIDYCRWYSDIGCKTNGHLREFFRNQEVESLYRLVMENSGSHPLAQLVSMGKTSFWGMFGTRIGAPGLREFIESLINKRDGK